MPFVVGDSPKDMSVWQHFPNIKRFMDSVNARPAAVKAEALRDRHAFKTEFDDEARRHMFKHLAA